MRLSYIEEVRFTRRGPILELMQYMCLFSGPFISLKTTYVVD